MLKPLSAPIMITVLLLAIGNLLNAAEISSNRVGGGAWSDPATWHGGVVPGASDDVVILKNDVVSFDRNDDGKVSCRKMQIDPKGVFTFKTSVGKAICCLGDALDISGVIKLDGTKSASDFFELRFVGATADQRKIKLAKGAGLLLYGKANLPDGRCNVALRSPKIGEQKDDLVSIVEADGVVSIDWQRAYIHEVKLIAKKIDNTGAKPNERLNLIDNQFTGQARVWLQYCDTPIISKNTFECKTAKPIEEAAINVSYSPLTEIKGNTIKGGFAIGITVNNQSDSVLLNNTVEKCAAGITGGYGIPNTMLRGCVVRDCAVGIKLEGASGVVEHTVVESATTAFHMQNSNMQLTHFVVKNLNPKGQAVLFDTGTLSLLNCNIAPAQIKIGVQPATAKTDPVTCVHYAIIAVKDAPADCLVDVRTTGLAADANDPNVRNTPAPLAGGLSPLPKTLNPLTVKAWTFDLKGKLLVGPEYTVRVLGPAAKEGDARPVLKTMTFRPQESAFRAMPDDTTPTLEVKFK